MRKKSCDTYRSLHVISLGVLFILTVQSSRGQNADEAAIKQVIRAETEAYYKADAQAWQGTWMHDATSNRAFVANNSYAAAMGWDKFGPQTVKWLTDSAKPFAMQLKDDNYTIKTDGNLAWVEYDQLITASTDSSQNSFTREFRLLVKDNNEWKINTLLTHAPESFNFSKPEAFENSLNSTGYNLLAANRVNDAIEVFQLNVKLNPKSWNTYDSLGEAYALAGNKELAISNYEKSVELNPNNDNGKKALAKLKQK